MIAHVRGTLAEKNLDKVVLEVGGVGLMLAVSLQTLQSLPQTGHNVSLYTYLYVREDTLALYGFASVEEKHIFELCISVSGIGPKLALAILSGMEAELLAQAIKQQDIPRLCRIPGVGKKTAERLIIELRDKVTPSKTMLPISKPMNDIVLALCNLGYRPAQAEKAADRVMLEHAQAPMAEVLRQALRLLQKE